MSDTSAGHAHGAGRYEIRLKGHLGPRWAARFDEMTLTTQADAKFGADSVTFAAEAGHQYRITPAGP